MEKYENQITIMTKGIVQVWYQYETDPRFLTITDDGIELDELKCCEQRAVSVCGALIHTFNNAENELHKNVILLSFAKAMDQIAEEEKLMLRRKPAPYMACISTVISTMKDLSDSLGNH